MWLRISILSLMAALSACSSVELKPNDIASLPPTATGGDGSIVAETWDNIGGRSVRALTRHAKYPNDSNAETVYPALDLVSLNADKYGQRIRSLFSVDVSGSYQFRLSADDSAELWLATDASPRNKRLLAFTNRPTGYKVWDRYKTQVSPQVSLEAGVEYFMEIIHKEGSGEDYLVVESALVGADYAVITQDQVVAYVPSSDTSTKPEPDTSVDPQEVHEVAYHAGYTAGMNLLAYDNTYPILDQDNDGVPDFFELVAGTDPTNFTDAIGDADGDALTNYEEYQLLSNPNNADSDGDSISDGYEIAYGLNPLDAGDATGDLDNDGFTNLEEYQANTAANDGSAFPVPLEKEVLLTWEAPTAREDGSALTTSDIERYKVYSGSSANSMTELTDVSDPAQLSLSQVLGEGTHYFAISTVTFEEGEGPLSEAISVTIN